MPQIDFSDDELKRGTVIQPAWYLIQLGPFVESMNKNGDAMNYIFQDSKIIKEADSGDTKFAGVPLRILFSGKPTAKGFLKGFLEAMGQEVKPGVRFELSAFAGKFIEVLVENEMYEGRMVNRVNHKYRPVRK
jgi:hypothetical protein